MSIVAKRSRISATAELLLNFAVCRDAARRACSSETARFFKMAVVCHFGFVVRLFGLPTKSTYLVFIARSAKFGWNLQCIVLKICEFQCYASLAWKCYCTPSVGVFGRNNRDKWMDTFAVLSLQKRNNLELTSYELNRKNRSPAILFPESSNCLVTNKCSAVAEMGDYLATVDIGPKTPTEGVQ